MNMKKVIFTQSENTVAISELMPANKFYLAKSKFSNCPDPELFILVSEPAGYIFRPTDIYDTSGHSGHHSTKIQAIKAAGQPEVVPFTEIFEFSDIREMCTFVANFARSTAQ